MNQQMKAVLTVILFVWALPLHAEDTVSNVGEWPKEWPVELEPLREHSQTRVVARAATREYLIPFTNRQDFEAAWPHLLKVKTKNAPIFLIRPPKAGVLAGKPASVYIHAPPANTSKPESPVDSENIIERWMWTTYIYLVVDGDVVDLNRVPIPPDTPIVDERFKGGITK